MVRIHTSSENGIYVSTIDINFRKVQLARSFRETSLSPKGSSSHTLDRSPGECRSAIRVVNSEGNMTRLITCQFLSNTTLLRKTIPWIIPGRSLLGSFPVHGAELINLEVKQGQIIPPVGDILMTKIFIVVIISLNNFAILRLSTVDSARLINICSTGTSKEDVANNILRGFALERSHTAIVCVVAFFETSFNIAFSRLFDVLELFALFASIPRQNIFLIYLRAFE